MRKITPTTQYDPDYMIQGSSEPLRYLSYAEEQLEHAIRKAEDEGKETFKLRNEDEEGDRMTNLIYRDMVNQALTEYIEGLNECTDNINPVSLLMGVQGIIRTMPPVKQEKGQWIKTVVRGSQALCCSCCGQESGVLYNYNYCPNCGVKMKGDIK